MAGQTPASTTALFTFARGADLAHGGSCDTFFSTPLPCVGLVAFVVTERNVRGEPQRNPSRLGDLQSRLHGAQGPEPPGTRIRQGWHHHPLGADAGLQ